MGNGKGNNRLLKQNQRRLVGIRGDLLELLEWAGYETRRMTICRFTAGSTLQVTTWVHGDALITWETGVVIHNSINL